jgi:CBS domain-containing protein
MVEQTDDRVTADAMAALGTQPTQTMICPVCGFANIQGDDLCANCGADLASSDVPQATTPFERLLTEVPLRALDTRPPFTVPASTSIAETLRLMRDQGTADVVVLDGDRLAGIFTERDAALRLVGGDGAVPSDLGSRPISSVMTADPVVLRADDSIAVAVQKMAIGGFRHIPLVRDGRPVGVVSAADVFRHLLRIVE